MAEDGTLPPASGSGLQPPVTTAAPPVTMALPVGVTQPGSNNKQDIFTTSGNGGVIASNTGVLGSGTVATTNTVRSIITTPTAGVQPDVLAGLLQSGLITTPAQVTDLQQKLAALTMGGMSVPLPPVNVTQGPFFKIASDSSIWELNSLVQAQQPVNIDTWSTLSSRLRGSTAL